MSNPEFKAPSLEGMHALIPAYEFHDILASNERGAVYYATQKSLDRKVALKVFSPLVANDPSFKRLYANCTASVAGLRHPNLISLYNSGFADGMPYLVMEFVPGKSLARSMKGGAIEFALSLTILKEACEGVAHAHEKEVVHGNLSPYDILLTQKASPKIGNFGLGPDVHTVDGVEVPKHFTAPEVLDGEAPTHASDIYSLAAIFYELITATPYRFGGPRPSSLEGTPEGVDEVLFQALSNDPAKRGTDALKFYEGLRQAAKGNKEAVPVVPQTAEEKTLEKKPAEPDGKVPAKAPRRAGSGRRGRGRSNAPAKTMPAKILKASNTPLVKIIAILVLLIAIHQVWSYRQSLKEERSEQAKRKKGGGEPIVINRFEMVQNPSKPTPQPEPSTPPNSTLPEDFGFPQDAETPMDSLERLRDALVQGSRSELPMDTITKGENHYFIVEQAMTWTDALAFAKKHGGYLALPSPDMSWRKAEHVRGRDVWLGAARSGTDSFALLDGKAWSPEGGISGSGSHVWMDGQDVFRTADPSQTKFFVIQWRADGSDPTRLEARLASAAASIQSSNPSYPLGTVVSGSRHYLPVSHPCTWEEAKALAESAGGHLAVLSDEKELGELQKAASTCPSATEFWTGGHLAGDSWVWTTQEPWRAVAWLNERNAGEADTAMLLKAGVGVDAQGKSAAASGFIIEWSKDKESNKAPANQGASPGEAIAELETRAKELVVKAGVDKEANHKKNTDKLAWDLDAHIRGLKKSDQDAIRPEMKTLKECVQNNRLHKETIDASGARLTPFMAKLCNYIIDKQARIDREHVVALQAIHTSYLTKLAQLRDQAKQAGQIKAQLKAAELIDGSQNFDAWVASMSN